jgi:ribose transport system substrate-binding protein
MRNLWHFCGSEILLAGFLIIGLLLTGCQKPKSDSAFSQPSNEGGPKKLRIAVIPKGTSHDFWKSVHSGAVRAASEAENVEILWKGPLSETEKEKQIKIVEGFLVEQVDGVCLAPIDRESLVPVVQRAKRRGIPTVVFDSGLSDQESIVSYVATDNYHGGVMAAEHLASLIGEKGGVILVRYQAGSQSTESREEGFYETLKKYPEIKILSANQRVKSDAEQALHISSSLLMAHQDQVKGVFTVCEPINKGMLRALENKKLGGKIQFVGFDSDPRMVEALRENKMQGIILQDPVRMGYLAVKTMVAHLRGEKVEKKIVTGETLATRENMDDPKIQALLNPEQFVE